ncbi:hypothetical protein KM043_009713 [Ampulex compressa]|nr:hypothetical protein KM043_009713 [Ampulex compressa]
MEKVKTGTNNRCTIGRTIQDSRSAEQSSPSAEKSQTNNAVSVERRALAIRRISDGYSEELQDRTRTPDISSIRPEWNTLLELHAEMRTLSILPLVLLEVRPRGREEGFPFIWPPLKLQRPGQL